MPRNYRIAYFAALLATSLVPLCMAYAAPPKSAPPKPTLNNGEATKGTEQMKGGDGVFGTIYTMVNGHGSNYNFQLLSARYTLEPHNDYAGSMPLPDQKLLVLTFAVKNPNKDSDLDQGGVDMTLVDENDNNYGEGAGTMMLASNGSKELYITLKPGQGFGQDPTANALSVAFVVPGNAKIKKILINSGRAAVPSEKIMRYTIAGNTGGSPKNVITPLPKYAADPTDPSGGVALETAPAVLGKYYPDGYFAARLNSVTLAPSDTVYKGEKAPDGKQWAIANFSVKNIYSKAVTTFEIAGDGIALKDMDGEKHPAEEGGRWKATRDEAAGSVEVDKGEESNFRIFFAVPKDVKLKSLLFPPVKYGHIYQWDLATAATP